MLAGTEPHETERLFFGHCRTELAWLSFGPPLPAGCGTAHVANMSALFCLSIEESPYTVTGTLPNGVGQRCRRGLATETHGCSHTVDQSRTARTFLAMPFNGIARRRLELSVQVP
jgi:hypothetical protein